MYSIKPERQGKRVLVQSSVHVMESSLAALKVKCITVDAAAEFEASRP